MSVSLSRFWGGTTGFEGTGFEGTRADDGGRAWWRLQLADVAASDSGKNNWHGLYVNGKFKTNQVTNQT